ALIQWQNLIGNEPLHRSYLNTVGSLHMIALEDRPLRRGAGGGPAARPAVPDRAGSPPERGIVGGRRRIIEGGGVGLREFQPDDVARREVLDEQAMIMARRVNWRVVLEAFHLVDVDPAGDSYVRTSGLFVGQLHLALIGQPTGDVHPR